MCLTRVCLALLTRRLPAGDRCTSCSGSCLVSEKKTFEVGIEPGMKQNSKIVLRGEAGCTEPGLQPGDVVLVLQQKEHDTFTRLPNPADLIFEKHISLKEALCGCAFNVKHLDGRTIRVTSVPGEVIKPSSFKVVPEEGMPVHTRPFMKGNLYIKFEVGQSSLSRLLCCCVCSAPCFVVLLVVSTGTGSAYAVHEGQPVHQVRGGSKFAVGCCVSVCCVLCAILLCVVAGCELWNGKCTRGHS
jgi:DnaJ family protein A protein 2